MSETTTGGENTAAASAATTTTTQETTQTQTAQTTATPPSDWTTGLKDDVKGYVANKGFKDPASILDSYMNMEKLMGAPRERLLKLPENMEDPVALTEIYTRLGRPATADGYKFEGEEADPDFAKFAKGTFHELGLTDKQAKNLMSKMGEYDKSMEGKEAEKFKAEIEVQEKALKTEWGAAHDERVAMAKRAFGTFKMSADLVDKMEAAIGYPAVMKFMYEIGSKLGEGTFVGNPNGGQGFILAPADAQNQLAALKQDMEFIKKVQNKDVAALEKWNKLHQQAYPS